MVTLILTICLASDPSVCREERPPVEITEPMDCIINAQVYAAEWVLDHPRWKLHGWKCEMGKKEGSA